jgi:hypothetical protein
VGCGGFAVAGGGRWRHFDGRGGGGDVDCGLFVESWQVNESWCWEALKRENASQAHAQVKDVFRDGA